MLIFIIIILFLAVGVGLTLFLLSRDRGPKEPVGALWIAVGFGIAGGILAYFLEVWLIPTKDTAVGAPLGTLLLSCLGVGLIEECCKFVPLALFIYKKRYFNEMTDGIIYFVIVGLGFGIPENILYTISYGAKTGLMRLILDPIFHAATTSMVGYFLAKSKIEKKSLWIPIGALFGAILVHGIFDFGDFSGNVFLAVMSMMITAGISACIFILFLRAKEVDAQLGISAQRVNKFCEHCGFPNPTGNSYCAHCGASALIKE